MFFKGVDAVAGAVTVTAGEITAIAVATKGTGYLTSPTINVTDSSGDGVGLSGVLGRAVDNISITQAGVYNAGSAPTVSFTNATGDTTGSGATATATLGFPLETVSLDTQGLGYRNLPLITISGDPTVAGTIKSLAPDGSMKFEKLTKRMSS